MFVWATRPRCAHFRLSHPAHASPQGCNFLESANVTICIRTRYPYLRCMRQKMENSFRVSPPPPSPTKLSFFSVFCQIQLTGECTVDLIYILRGNECDDPRPHSVHCVHQKFAIFLRKVSHTMRCAMCTLFLQCQCEWREATKIVEENQRNAAASEIGSHLQSLEVQNYCLVVSVMRSTTKVHRENGRIFNFQLLRVKIGYSTKIQECLVSHR